MKPNPCVVKTTKDYKYKLKWIREDQSPNVLFYKRYLMKISNKDGKIVSQLLIGEDTETAD